VHFDVHHDRLLLDLVGKRLYLGIDRLLRRLHRDEFGGARLGLHSSASSNARHVRPHATIAQSAPASK
jgi:hypothetical protein